LGAKKARILCVNVQSANSIAATRLRARLVFYLGSEQELLKIIRRFYHPKAATVDLIEMEPSLVLRNCLPTADANRVMNW